MPKQSSIYILTPPVINPETGYEDGLPPPRGRDEIYREMLASHQSDSTTHLFDIYYRLQLILSDMKPLVDAELERIRAEGKQSKSRKHRK